MIERARILKCVDAQIRVTFQGRSEVIQFLLNHERKNHFVDQLMAELWKVNQRKVLKSPALLGQLINDFTNMFARAAIQKAEQDILSANERSRRIAEHDQIANAEQIASEIFREGKEVHNEI